MSYANATGECIAASYLTLTLGGAKEILMFQSVQVRLPLSRISCLYIQLFYTPFSLIGNEGFHPESPFRVGYRWRCSRDSTASRAAVG